MPFVKGLPAIYYITAMFNFRILTVILCAGVFCFAQNIKTNNKSVSVKVKGLPAQYTSLRIDTLSRCIQNLPDTANIIAATEGRTEYLKKISGTDKNDYVKIWNAKVQLVYQWKYKLHYLLMPQGGLEAQAPVFPRNGGNRSGFRDCNRGPARRRFLCLLQPAALLFQLSRGGSKICG